MPVARSSTFIMTKRWKGHAGCHKKHTFFFINELIGGEKHTTNAHRQSIHLPPKLTEYCYEYN